MSFANKLSVFSFVQLFSFYNCFQFFFPECQISCFEDSCYMLQNQGPVWNDNRILCQKQGADPVSIETVKDWNFLNDLIQKPKSKYNKWIIGLEKEAGNLTWLSGKSLTICKWDKNQASDDEDVAIIVKTSLNDSKVGLFQMTHGDQPYASICEINKGKRQHN